MSATRLWVRYELARAIFNDRIAERAALVDDERSKPAPDLDRINLLLQECLDLRIEGDALSFNSSAEIERVIVQFVP